MAVKSNVLKKNKKAVMNLFLLIVVLLILSIVIPMIGVTASSPLIWINIVDFFEAVNEHFRDLWMFYTFIVFVVFNYFRK